MTAPVLAPAARRRWAAIGTWCEVLAPDELMAELASAVAVRRLAELDAACSRFRADSELSRLPHGTEVSVGATLSDAVAAALRTAAWTDGLVDPTVGTAVRALGYDDDLARVQARPDRGTLEDFRPAPGFWRVSHSAAERTLLVPRGVELDLGASAKAWLADVVADELGRTLPGSYLVNLGGDLALAGPAPEGGWQVAVDDGSPAHEQTVVSLRTGALATSSTRRRTWTTAGRAMHHIVDPRTGGPADPVWATVTVAARTCELANAAATAAVVLGTEGPGWLAGRGLHARLVSTGGAVVYVGDWPAEQTGTGVDAP